MPDMLHWLPSMRCDVPRAEEMFCDEFHLVDLRVADNCKKVTLLHPAAAGIVSLAGYIRFAITARFMY